MPGFLPAAQRLLNLLSNRDKHRMLTPTFGVLKYEIDGLSLVRTNPEAIVLEAKSHWKAGMPLKHDTKLAWWRFDTRGAFPQMHVKEPITFDVTFRGSDEGHPVRRGDRPPGFNVLREHVRKIVSDAEVFFL